MSADTPALADLLEGQARLLDRPDRSLDDALRAEDLREDARLMRQRIQSSRDHIARYYGLLIDIDTLVKHEGQPGRVVGFSGQYVAVLLDGDKEPTVHHATAGMEYPAGTQIGPGPDERFAHLVEIHDT